MFQGQVSNARLRRLGCSAAFLASLMLLSSCVSTGLSKSSPEAAGENDAADEVEVPVVPDADGKVAAGSQIYRDPQAHAVNGTQQDVGYPTQTAMMPEDQAGEPGSIVLQSTGLKATSSSIFATRPARALVPGPQAESHGAGASSNSLFNAGQMAQDPGVAPQDSALPLKPLPEGQGTAADEATPLPQDELGAASKIPNPIAKAEVAAAEQPDKPSGTPDKTAAVEALSLAGLFSAKRKARNTATQTDLPNDQVAALGYAALPKNRAISMFATVEDEDPNHDDESSAIQKAALPGLARLAPNGLWLQTSRVETGCFKPELMGILKSVEKRYNQKVIVTSGHRDVAYNAAVGGARMSRHITCEAADIQVPGVSKWELASYLRALPGRGGVGTYCHTQSVHIDVGKRRDWNWGCTRKV
ncbi:D-Ala-D-Ala carboxypeptidase family metallohydrolase [Pararhizobium arenae]|uniref:D-Ala-D-Ala carboxypeptidase family metallohydrolase n=1 Tax=Pararhizobium arenae TaxID=1856850 RepID=UPI0009F96933|nr:D-Ala-D-Ala carboxypeptidase family metallohydrolase [Pararhizobium arenae]